MISAGNKEKIEFWNSIFWFLMDAMWMFSQIELSLIFAIPTVLTGTIVIFMNNKFADILVDFSMLMWILMNISWLISEEFEIPELLLTAKSSFIIGIATLILASLKSDQGMDIIIKKFRRYKKPSL